jgi:hypothetical protein
MPASLPSLALSLALIAVFAAGCDRTGVGFDTPTHFKNGAQGKAGDVAFTVRMLPKEMVSGPVPEIEAAQIECSRGAEHGIIQIDTLKKRASWGGVTFELMYADVYHDDIELQLHRP